MRKKGQVQGQIFIYILTLIIAGVIFIFGYNSITSFSKQIENTKVLDFEVDINQVFDKIGSEYQSFDRRTFTLPQNYKQVCFVNLDHPDMIPGNLPSDLDDYPFMKESLDDRVGDNVFIYKDMFEASFNIGRINIKPEDPNNQEGEPFKCYTLLNGQLNLDIRGLGDRAQIEETVPEES